MSSSLTTSFLVLVLISQVIFTVTLPPYLFDGYVAEDFPGGSGGAVGEGDVSMDRLLQGLNKRSPVIYVYRRSCVRRGSRCDHRPDDCCYGGACRCNLWGTNCQCQRMGLFQKWG